MNTLGVILARAGSEGLKGKHLRDLLGKPVIDYTFAYANKCRQLTRTVVSTDCPEISKLAASAGFTVIARPKELATSDASVQDVMLHALENVEKSSPFKADALVVLYGNVPVRPDGAVDQAIALLEKTRCDSVRSYCPVGKWHPAWMSSFDGDKVIALQPGSIHRRQDLTPLFLHDGAVVAVSRDSMLRGKTDPTNPHAFFGVDRRGIHTGMGDTVEVDHIRDLYWAEAVLRDRAA